MANIVRRESNVPVNREGGMSPTRLFRDLSPFDRMRDFMRWDPFQEMARMWPSLEPFGSAPGYLPAFDVRETKDAYVFKADCPGFQRDAIDVKVTGNRLTICGQRIDDDSDESDTYYFCERSQGTFTRTFTLPEATDVEQVSAQLTDGVLTVQVPKSAAARSRSIPLQGGKSEGKVKA
jgi:HSP20 family protein